MYFIRVLGRSIGESLGIENEEEVSFLSHVTFIIAISLNGELTRKSAAANTKICVHPQKGSALGFRRGVLSMTTGRMAAEGPCSYFMNDWKLYKECQNEVFRVEA